MNIINEDSDDQIDSFELKQKEFETIFFNDFPRMKIKIFS